MLEAIADFFNVDMDYLTGKTSTIKSFDKIYNSEKISKEAELYEKIQECFGKEAAKLMHMYDSFNIEGKEKLLDMAMDMSDLERYSKYNQEGLSNKEVI